MRVERPDMIPLTNRRIVIIGLVGVLAGGSAGAVAVVAGDRDAEATAVVSLAPLIPEVSAYFLVPVAADFQAFMNSTPAASAAADASGSPPGVFSTVHEQDASDITVIYRAGDEVAAETGLSGGVRAGFEHLIAAQVRRGTLATESADRRVQATKEALVAFQRRHGIPDLAAAHATLAADVAERERAIAAGNSGAVAAAGLARQRASLLRLSELEVDDQIVRSELDQALKQQGDARRALSLVDGLAASLAKAPAVTQLQVATASPLPLVLRSAGLGVVSGGLLAFLQLWIVSGLRTRDPGPSRRRPVPSVPPPVAAPLLDVPAEPDVEVELSEWARRYGRRDTAASTAASTGATTGAST